MSIFNFVQKLLPRIERHTVAEDLRTTERECGGIVIPSWEAGAEYFKLNKLASDEAYEFGHIFYNSFDLRRASKAPNLVMEISRRLPTLHANIRVIQTVLDEMVEKDIMPDGLTVRSAFILRAASNMSLLTRYLLALLNYLYTVEAKHHDIHLDPALEIAKAEMKYVDQNFQRFAKLFSEYSMPTKEFEALVRTRPEVSVAGNNRLAVTGMYSELDLDPFHKFGISGFVGNPIYQIRMVVARWQNDRYESAKAKKQQLELRLLYLQMQKDGKADAVTVKEISRLQDRIEKLDQYLREVDEAVKEDK